MSTSMHTVPETFPEYWRRISACIETEIERRLPQMFSAGPGPVLEAVTRALHGGKRIRGCLVCLMCNALGGRTEEALPRAVAVECIQAASLIHDDFIDGDRIRRNQPAGWVADGSRRAVLLGDLIFATAIEQMAANGPVESALISFAIAAMARGAFMEQTQEIGLAAAANGDPYTHRIEHYDEIVRLKTGVLFAAAGKFGALAADASGETQRAAFEFGQRLGRVYQLADDLMEAGALEGQTSPVSRDMISVAPIALRFTSSRARGLGLLESGNSQGFGAWLQSEIPSVRVEMRRAIRQSGREA
ncbi:MAG TPA: polyprenyl synthetase family protein, partial [Gammaproteobacteria bacterium]|nr:polyprenyl synthetase family protein [Gammaproteobacteria bacterium]